jgi:hypothetical protein
MDTLKKGQNACQTSCRTWSNARLLTCAGVKTSIFMDVCSVRPTLAQIPRPQLNPLGYTLYPNGYRPQGPRAGHPPAPGRLPHAARARTRPPQTRHAPRPHARRLQRAWLLLQYWTAPGDKQHCKTYTLPCVTKSGQEPDHCGDRSTRACFVGSASGAPASGCGACPAWTPRRTLRMAAPGAAPARAGRLWYFHRQRKERQTCTCYPVHSGCVLVLW